MTAVNPVKMALDHVRKSHPDVTMVVFNQFGDWCFMNDEFETPEFDANIDTNLLRAAASYVPETPSMYHYALF